MNSASLLKDLLSDYIRIIQPTEPVSASCSSCIESYRLELTKTITKMENAKNSGYKLHKKYEGITLFGSGLVITNKDLSDEIAQRLLKEHPRGDKLFESIPAKEIEVEAPKVEAPKKRKSRKKSK